MLLGAYNIPPKVLFYKENSALISELLQPDGNQSLKPVWHDFSVIMQSYDPALSNYSLHNNICCIESSVLLFIRHHLLDMLVFSCSFLH